MGNKRSEIVNQYLFSRHSEILYALSSSIEKIGSMVFDIYEEIPPECLDELGGKHFAKRFDDIQTLCNCLGSLASTCGEKAEGWSMAICNDNLEIRKI